MNKIVLIKEFQEEFAAGAALEFTPANLATVETHWVRLEKQLSALVEADPKNPAIGRLVNDFAEAQKHLKAVAEVDAECGRAQSDILSGSLADEEINSLQAELATSDEIMFDLMNEIQTLWSYCRQDVTTLAQAYQAAERLNA